jgi:rubrerythrin
MSLRYSADEIFAMAEQIERNGVNFYRRAAEFAGDAKRRQLLQNLAGWEQEHERTFAAMRAGFAAKGGAASLDPGSEADLYLRAMADGRVFDVRGDPSSKLTGRETMVDILRAAIGLEKDSIVFYLGMREMVPKGADKDRVDYIIKQEMQHVVVLDTQLGEMER